MEEFTSSWFKGSGLDGMRMQEYIMNGVNMSPASEATSPSADEVTTDQLGAIYPGPTIQDVENGLSMPDNKTDFPDDLSVPLRQPRILTSEGGLMSQKIEINKYTLKIKSCDSADDGYRWRKYGQKSIKNSPNPRSYYRCTNPRCSAKKQVEKSTDDPDSFLITYEGLHLHFAFPSFGISEAQPVYQPTKRLRTSAQDHEAQDHEARHQSGGGSEEGPTMPARHGQGWGQEGMGSRGLLEDMVPLMVRCPSNSSASPNSSSSLFASSPTSPPSLSWSPNYY